MSTDLELPGTVVELEALAESRVDQLAWDYIAHGSGDEITMRDNVAAWERLRLRPHVLRDMLLNLRDRERDPVLANNESRDC